MGGAAPGWYPDPSGRSGEWRYFDGLRWTGHKSGAPTEASSGSKHLPMLVWIVSGLLLALVLSVIVFVASRPQPDPKPTLDPYSYRLGYDIATRKLRDIGVANCESIYEAELLFAGDPLLNPGPTPDRQSLLQGCKDAGGDRF